MMVEEGLWLVKRISPMLLAALLFSPFYIPAVTALLLMLPFTLSRASAYLFFQHKLTPEVAKAADSTFSKLDGKAIAKALGEESASLAVAQKLKQDTVKMVKTAEFAASSLREEKDELISRALRDTERLKLEKELSDKLMEIDKLKEEIGTLHGSKKREQ